MKNSDKEDIEPLALQGTSMHLERTQQDLPNCRLIVIKQRQRRQ